MRIIWVLYLILSRWTIRSRSHLAFSRNFGVISQALLIPSRHKHGPLAVIFMRLQTTILTLLVLTSVTVNAKTYLIDIKEKLNQASHIKTIVVYGYRDSVMLYGTIGQSDTLTLGCRLRKKSEEFRLSLIEKKAIKNSDLAGKWPDPGDKVLVVINSAGRVELFAKRLNNKYRFWDPTSIPFGNSVFLIPKEPEYQPIDNCDDIFPGLREGYLTCTDGCLVIATFIKEK